MSSQGKSPNPFTAEQEKMYEEMFEASEFHRKEMDKYEQRLKYYRDWKNTIRAAEMADPHPYTEAEEKEFEEMAEASQFHFREMMKCQQSLKYYRDLKNVIETAFMEGLEKGRRKALEESQREGERRTL